MDFLKGSWYMQEHLLIIFKYFCLIFTFCGITKKECLMSWKFVQISGGDVHKKTYTLKWMIQLQMNLSLRSVSKHFKHTRCCLFEYIQFLIIL
jgi:hypothetical protein